MIIEVRKRDSRGVYQHWGPRFSAWYDGGMLVASSKQPFLDAARVLAARGVPAETRIVMRHQGSDEDALISTVGVAAGLMVREQDIPPSEPRFVRWKPFPLDTFRAGCISDDVEHPDSGEDVKRAGEPESGIL